MIEVFLSSGWTEGRGYWIADQRGLVATLGEHTNPAWLARLARVPKLEDLIRRALTVRSFHQEVAIREEMAKLAAEFETCVCRRVVSEAERCPLCAACPVCEEKRPCTAPDPALEAQEYEAPAGVRY
jgi:hypothetical protein